jgi:hypothetical protein
LSIGADAPSAKKPSPASDPVLPKSAVEYECAPLDLKVDVVVLRDPVDVDVEVVVDVDVAGEPDDRASH